MPHSDRVDYFFESLFANLKRGDNPIDAVREAAKDLQTVYFPEEKESVIKPPSPDQNVETVRSKMLIRSIHGLQKYGKTTFDNPLQLREWLIHLQEELMDGIVYIEAALNKLPEEPNHAKS